MANWIELVKALQPAALTVRAQAVPFNDDGTLLWEVFAPRVDVDSVELSEITTTDPRFVSDRRDWNAPGRLIPIATPAIKQYSMIPIEGYYIWDEYQLQFLDNRSFGNQQLVQQQIMADVPGHTENIARANSRRIEVDFFTAWHTGTITVRDPQDATNSYAVSLGFDAARYTTAATAWNDGSINAYNAFLTWLRSTQTLIGGVQGAMMRQATLNAILADAPDLPGGAAMTEAGLEARIAADLRVGTFTIVVNERTVNVFTDGGTATTATNVWAAQRVAAIPTGLVVGRTAFAPVKRARDVARQVPTARIDVRGQAAYMISENDDKALKLNVQVNALSIPDESKMAVINAGV